MLKQKQFIAAALVCCLLFAVLIASFYVIKLSKSLTNMLPTGKPLASFENFHVIAHDLDEMGDLNLECKEQLGNGMRIADWNDIVTFYETGGSLDEFIKGLKMSIREDMLDLFVSIKRNSESKSKIDEQQLLPYSPGSGYRISFNGEPRYGGSERHYFVARHDHIKPPGFLDHDNLNNYRLTVGSWFAQGGYALCYGELDDNALDNSLASYDNFHVIGHSLNEMEDHNAECIAQLGEDVRLADWHDIVAYYDGGGKLDDFIFGLKMSLRDDMKARFDSIQNSIADVDLDTDPLQPSDLLGNQYRISKDGNLKWQGNRHYFVGRHDHLKPFDFLDHDDLNNYQLTLGSWFGQGGFALSYGKLLDIPIPLSKVLKSTSQILTFLIVGCLILFGAFLSIQILKLPNWLMGKNVDAIRQNIEMKRNQIEELERLQASISNEDISENVADSDSDSNT